MQIFAEKLPSSTSINRQRKAGGACPAAATQSRQRAERRELDGGDRVAARRARARYVEANPHHRQSICSARRAAAVSTRIVALGSSTLTSSRHEELKNRREPTARAAPPGQA